MAELPTSKACRGIMGVAIAQLLRIRLENALYHNVYLIGLLSWAALIEMRKGHIILADLYKMDIDGKRPKIGNMVSVMRSREYMSKIGVVGQTHQYRLTDRGWQVLRDADAICAGVQAYYDQLLAEL